MKFFKNTLSIIALFAASSVFAKDITTKTTAARTTTATRDKTPVAIRGRQTKQQNVTTKESASGSSATYPELLAQVRRMPPAKVINNTNNQLNSEFVESIVDNKNLSFDEAEALLQAAVNMHATWSGDNARDQLKLQTLNNQVAMNAYQLKDLPTPPKTGQPQPTPPKTGQPQPKPSASTPLIKIGTPKALKETSEERLIELFKNLIQELSTNERVWNKTLNKPTTEFDTKINSVMNVMNGRKIKFQNDEPKNIYKEMVEAKEKEFSNQKALSNEQGQQIDDTQTKNELIKRLNAIINNRAEIALWLIAVRGPLKELRDIDKDLALKYETKIRNAESEDSEKKKETGKLNS